MSLETGEQLHSNNWVKRSITDAVIDAVNERRHSEDQPVLRDGTPIFEWRRGLPIDEEDATDASDDDDYNPDEQAFGEEDYESHSANEDNSENECDEDPIENEEENDDIVEDNKNPDNKENPVQITGKEDSINEGDYNSDDAALQQEQNNPEQENADKNTVQSDIPSDNGEIEETIEETVEPDDNEEQRSDDNSILKKRSVDHSVDDEERSGAENEQRSVNIGGYSLGGDRERSYGHRFNFLQKATDDFENRKRIDDKLLHDCYKEIVHVCFTQMTGDREIKTYGQCAVNAIFTEFAQLNDLKVFGPLDANKLSRDQKRTALRVIILIKEKRCGKIKG